MRAEFLALFAFFFSDSFKLFVSEIFSARIFDLFDDDKSGNINIHNLRRVAKELGENMTDDEITEMIEEADRNNDGVIDREVRSTHAPG